MTLRTRILDILPALVVFAIVAAFATFVLIEYVIREPMVIPKGHTQTTVANPSAPTVTPSR